MSPLIDPQNVTAVIVTRGDIDLTRQIASLEAVGYGEILVWENETGTSLDMKVYGRHLAARKAKNDVIFHQDDDLILPLESHQALLAGYEDDGRMHSNMIGPEWWDHCGYNDFCFFGAGTLVHREEVERAISRYNAHYPLDDFFALYSDCVLGPLIPFKRYELTTEILPEASADNRMWRQEGEFEEKWQMINRGRSLRTVVLTMLVKNEVLSVGRAIRSAAPWVDHVLVHDTGSEDMTTIAVKSACDQAGLGCTIRHVEPVLTKAGLNFGYHRAELLSDARQFGDYQLLMDADEELVELPEKRPLLEKDAYYLSYEGSIDWKQPRLIRSYIEWFWQDSTHSYLATDDPHVRLRSDRGEMLSKPLIRHHGSDKWTPEKLIKQTEALVESVNAKPTDPRNVFQLAKAVEGVAIHEGMDTELLSIAADLYRARTGMGGWDEEAWYARYRLGAILCVTTDLREGVEELIRAWRERPWRVEPLRAIADMVTNVADRAPYPERDMLFVHREHYTSTPQGGNDVERQSP